MTCNSRAKGVRLELEARDKCTDLWFAPECVRNGQTSGGVCADIGNALPRSSVEVKGRKTHACFRYIEKCREDAKEGELPVLLMREDGHKDWLVAFYMDETADFVSRYLRALHLHSPELATRFTNDSFHGE